ncbi:MAG: MBL fold metallo-hydrolase [Filifactoraceae bacterium]
MIIQRLDRNKMGVNSYVIHEENKSEALVIDPGLNFNNIINYCREKELIVKSIVLTHGHYDHILDTQKLKEEYSCDIYSHIDEKIILNNADKNLSSAVGVSEEFDADFYVVEGDEITLGNHTFKVLHTPGHTKGGICLYDRENLISGDTLFKGSMGRTDLYSGSESEMMNSLRRLRDLPDDVKVYPGHGPTSTIKFEKEKNPYMRMA